MRTILCSSPNELQPYADAYKRKVQMMDSQMWQMGIYIKRAVGVAVASCLAGNKSKAKYFEEPLMTVAEREARLDKYYKSIGTDRDTENFKKYVEVFNANWDLKGRDG